MNHSLTKTALGILALGLMATGAQADWGHAGPSHSQVHQQTRAYGQEINARQDRQMDRIQAGKQSGQLTRAEFRSLMQEQHRIRTMERHFRADGRLDAREFRRLDHALNMANRNIRVEKHDYQARQAYGNSPRYN